MKSVGHTVLKGVEDVGATKVQWRMDRLLLRQSVGRREVNLLYLPLASVPLSAVRALPFDLCGGFSAVYARVHSKGLEGLRGSSAGGLSGGPPWGVLVREGRETHGRDGACEALRSLPSSQHSRVLSFGV